MAERITNLLSSQVSYSYNFGVFFLDEHREKPWNDFDSKIPFFISNAMVYNSVATWYPNQVFAMILYYFVRN